MTMHINLIQQHCNVSIPKNLTPVAGFEPGVFCPIYILFFLQVAGDRMTEHVDYVEDVAKLVRNVAWTESSNIRCRPNESFVSPDER
jgi:hypothetical protein